MADYAGAVAAMRDRFAQNFSAAPVAYPNEEPPQTPWPPAGPWVLFEVVQVSSTIRGAGLPGNQTWLTLGHIYIQIFVPMGYAFPEHLRIAGLAGEIFRAKTFYTTDPGAKVLCMAPMIQGGDGSFQGSDRSSETAGWFGMTVAIPFEFFFIA